MQNSIVRLLRIFAATLDKLGKYFVVFNFRGTGLTVKYSQKLDDSKIFLFTVLHFRDRLD